MAFRWLADDVPPNIDIYLDRLSPLKIHSCTPSDKTFWIRAWCRSKSADQEAYFRVKLADQNPHCFHPD